MGTTDGKVMVKIASIVDRMECPGSPLPSGLETVTMTEPMLARSLLGTVT